MTDQELGLLSRLSGPVFFGSYAIAPAAGSDLWLIEPTNAPPIKLWGDSQDVEFKFECLYICVDEPDPTKRPKGSLYDQAELDVRDVKLVFRACWKQKAIPGEVRPDWTQVVERRGRLDSIPDDATAACVAIVGLLLTDVSGFKTLLCLSDGPPTCIERITNAEQTAKILEESEALPPDQVATLHSRLQGWDIRSSK